MHLGVIPMTGITGPFLLTERIYSCGHGQPHVRPVLGTLAHSLQMLLCCYLPASSALCVCYRDLEGTDSFPELEANERFKGRVHVWRGQDDCG